MIKILIFLSLLSPCFGFSNEEDPAEEEKLRAEILNKYGGGVDKYEQEKKEREDSIWGNAKPTESIKKYNNAEFNQEENLRKSLESLSLRISELEFMSEEYVALMTSDIVLNSPVKEATQDKMREKILLFNNEIQAGLDIKKIINQGSVSEAGHTKFIEFLKSSQKMIQDEKSQRVKMLKIASSGGETGNQGLMKQISEELGEQALDEGALTALMNSQMQMAMKRMMEENPFSEMSREDLKYLFLTKLGPTPVGKFLVGNEKIFNVMIEVFHDKKAIPSFLSVTKESKKMKIYAGVFFLVFVVTFFVNFSNKKAGFFKRFFVKFTLMWVATFVNCFVFYILFSTQLSPMISAIKRGWNL